MKRRIALKYLGAGLSAGIGLPFLSSCKEDEVTPKIKYEGTVAIIGAGAAGLYAADYLIENGIKVEIYEASDRIGGRVKTLRPFDNVTNSLWFNKETNLSSDFPVELGADRILGPTSAWGKFVKDQKYATLQLEGPTTQKYLLNGQIIDYTIASANPEFVAAENFFNNLGSNAGSSQSVQGAVQGAGINPSMHPILNGWIGSRYGTSNPRLGVGPIAQEISLRQRGEGEFLVESNPMSDVLIGSFIRAADKTQLNTVIKSINYEGEKIVLTGEKTTAAGTEQFTSTVDKVIITVPVAVLKSGDITFSPALPSAKTTALSIMGMDNSIRVILDFRKNFWGEGFRFLYGGTEAAEYLNPGAAGRSTVARILSATITGEKAEALSPLGIDMIPNLLGELDLAFSGQASPNLRYDAVNDQPIAVIQDWGKEPYIKGSISYLKPGGKLSDRETLAAPVGEKLFFAGEATDFNGEAGTVSGALLSGERAAKEILALITA